MMVWRWVSSKSSTWELIPLTSEAWRMSSRSFRPRTVAVRGPESSESADKAQSTVSWRAPPRAQPTQLTIDRAASLRAASGMSDHLEATTKRARVRVAPAALDSTRDARQRDKAPGTAPEDLRNVRLEMLMLISVRESEAPRKTGARLHGRGCYRLSLFFGSFPGGRRYWG